MALVKLVASCIMDTGDVPYEVALEAIQVDPTAAVVAMLHHPELVLEVFKATPVIEPTSNLIIH